MEDENGNENGNGSTNDNGNNTVKIIVLILKILLAIIIIVGIYIVFKWLDTSDLGKGMSKALGYGFAFLDDQFQNCSVQKTCKNYDSNEEECDSEITCVYKDTSEEGSTTKSGRCYKKDVKRTTGSGGLTSIKCLFGIWYVLAPIVGSIVIPIMKWVGPYLGGGARSAMEYLSSMKGLSWPTTVKAVSKPIESNIEDNLNDQVNDEEGIEMTGQQVQDIAESQTSNVVGTVAENAGSEASGAAAMQAGADAGEAALEGGSIVVENTMTAMAESLLKTTSEVEELLEAAAESYTAKPKPVKKRSVDPKNSVHDLIKIHYKYNTKHGPKYAKLLHNLVNKHNISLHPDHKNYLEKYL